MHQCSPRAKCSLVTSVLEKGRTTTGAMYENIRKTRLILRINQFFHH